MSIFYPTHYIFLSKVPKALFLTSLVGSTLLIIAIAAITCYISIFIETDVNEMKKLFLLVDRAYFEIYRDKYEQILEKAVVALRKKFKDEVMNYDRSSFSKTA